jgi:hypothetical protein
MRLSSLMLTEARLLTGQIRSLNLRIGELEGLIEKERPRLAGHRNLLSSKGIGPVSLKDDWVFEDYLNFVLAS